MINEIIRIQYQVKTEVPKSQRGGQDEIKPEVPRTNLLGLG